MEFRAMFFGFFFLFFDLNIGKFNLLPEVVGYIILFFIVSAGIKKLPNANFITLKKSYLLLIFLSGLELIIKYTPLLDGKINNLNTIPGLVFSILFNITLVFMSIYSLFHLTKGIATEAYRFDDPELVLLSKRVFKFVATLQICFALLTLTMMVLFQDQSAQVQLDSSIGIILVIGAIVFNIYLINQVARMLKRADGTINRNIVV